MRSACSQRNHGALIVARDEETLGHSAFSSVCVCVCVCDNVIRKVTQRDGAS